MLSISLIDSGADSSKALSASAKISSIKSLACVVDGSGAGRLRGASSSNSSMLLSRVSKLSRGGGLGFRFGRAIDSGKRAGSAAGLVLSGDTPFAAGCREVVHQLQLAKLVWIDPEGGLGRPDGARISYVDLVELDGLVAGLEHIFGDLDTHTGVAVMAVDLILAKGSLGGF